MEEALKEVCMVSILSESTMNVCIYGFVREVLIDSGSVSNLMRRRISLNWRVFSNEARPPPEVKLTPQNLQLLFFERLHWVSVSFYKFLLESRRQHSVAKISSCSCSCSTATKPALAIHSLVKSVMQKSVRLILIGRWSDSWDNWNKGRNAAGVPFFSFLHSSPPPPPPLFNAGYLMGHCTCRWLLFTCIISHS